MGIRLDRRLVALGVGSRREVERLVRRGRVTADGAVVRDPGHHVDDDAALTLDGDALTALPDLVAWHKPVGVLTAVRDPWGREGLDEVLPARWRGHLHPVGRLDKDTSGLLLFSRHGSFTQWVLHPKRAIPRTYVATVEAVPADLAARLAAGVETADGVAKGVVEGVVGRQVRLTVTEGKHRMVRRMLHNAGASVTALHRVAYGAAALEDLAEGAFREVPLSVFGEPSRWLG